MPVETLNLFRLFSAVAIVASICTALVGCATDDRIYRDASPLNRNVCGTPDQPVSIDTTGVTRNSYEIEAVQPEIPGLRCPVQTYNAGHTYTYDLAFVEMLDVAKSSAVSTQQLALNSYLDAQLKKGEPLWVYVFVHGWRHNADLMDNDVAKFHTILALSKNHLNQNASQTKAKVLGIYVGWRGKSMPEAGGPLGPPIPFTFLSIIDRKKQSDKHADQLREFLEGLQTILTQDTAKPTKLITIGHSLGGNMLLRATTPLLTATLSATPSGQVVKGFGDMVVLLNPASELSNWQVLQRASRAHVGIKNPDRNSYLNKDECEAIDGFTTAPTISTCTKHPGTHDVYPKGQLPVLLSFTASKHFNKMSPTNVIGTVDNATGYLFPIVKWVMNPLDSELETTALGHALPRRAWGKDDKPDHYAKDNLLYGLSHEMDINKTPKIETTYKNAITEVYGCTASRTGLIQKLEAKIARLKKTNGRGWEDENLTLYESIVETKTISLVINAKHEVARGHCSGDTKTTGEHAKTCQDIAGNNQIPRLGQAREPYWNVAANPNFVVDHGGYVSNAMWCFVNSLVMPEK